MGIRIYSFICFIFFYSSALAQFEEQRKFAVENFDSIKHFIKNSENTNSLSTHFHSEFIYYDIYMDTPDFKLFQEGYSLRFRKRTRVGHDKEVSYTFQLKSEMNSPLGIRMEVEEPELSFYEIYSDSKLFPLTNVLDSIFHLVSKRTPTKYPILQNSLELLCIWIKFKSESPISPFQKLLYLEVLNTQEIKSLIPVVCGISRRYRSHIFTNIPQNKVFDLPQNRIKRNNLPSFFNENKHYNWLLESSLDNSRFFDLRPGINVLLNIKELEVENKYFMPEKGTKVLSAFEKDLARMFNLKAKKESKYKQAVTTIM